MCSPPPKPPGCVDLAWLTIIDYDDLQESRTKALRSRHAVMGPTHRLAARSWPAASSPRSLASPSGCLKPFVYLVSGNTRIDRLKTL